jgi:AmiR/NasT family two-component response regulator
VAHDSPADADDTEVVIARLVAATGIAQERQAQLQHALESRVVIEQAKGMLAERFGVSIDDAFELLRGTARSNRLRLHDVARRVVARDDSFAELLARGRS